MAALNEPPVLSLTQTNGIVEHHISDLGGWDDFESLVEFVVRRFSAEVIEKLDGICSRTWTLRIGEIFFTMKHHDDIGNFFFVADTLAEKQELMGAIADALNSQLCR